MLLIHLAFFAWFAAPATSASVGAGSGAGSELLPGEHGDGWWKLQTITLASASSPSGTSTQPLQFSPVTGGSKQPGWLANTYSAGVGPRFDDGYELSKSCDYTQVADFYAQNDQGEWVLQTKGAVNGSIDGPCGRVEGHEFYSSYVFCGFAKPKMDHNGMSLNVSTCNSTAENSTSFKFQLVGGFSYSVDSVLASAFPTVPAGSAPSSIAAETVMITARLDATLNPSTFANRTAERVVCNTSFPYGTACYGTAQGAACQACYTVNATCAISLEATHPATKSKATVSLSEYSVALPAFRCAGNTLDDFGPTLPAAGFCPFLMPTCNGYYVNGDGDGAYEHSAPLLSEICVGQSRTLPSVAAGTIAEGSSWAAVVSTDSRFDTKESCVFSCESTATTVWLQLSRWDGSTLATPQNIMLGNASIIESIDYANVWRQVGLLPANVEFTPSGSPVPALVVSNVLLQQPAHDTDDQANMRGAGIIFQYDSGLAKWAKLQEVSCTSRGAVQHASFADAGGVVWLLVMEGSTSSSTPPVCMFSRRAGEPFWTLKQSLEVISGSTAYTIGLSPPPRFMDSDSSPMHLLCEISIGSSPTSTGIVEFTLDASAGVWVLDLSFDAGGDTPIAWAFSKATPSLFIMTAGGSDVSVYRAGHIHVPGRPPTAPPPPYPGSPTAPPPVPVPASSSTTNSAGSGAVIGLMAGLTATVIAVAIKELRDYAARRRGSASPRGIYEAVSTNAGGP